MIRTLFISLLLIAAIPLSAASIDCSKARTSVEKAICSSPELQKADDQLAQAYHEALARSAQTAPLVRDSQRKWLRSAELACNPLDKNYPLADCLEERWRNRIDYLQKAVVSKGGVTFFMREFSSTLPRCGDDQEMNKPQANPQPDDDGGYDFHSQSCTLYVTWPEALSKESEWRAWNSAVLRETHRFTGLKEGENGAADFWVLEPDPAYHSDVEVSVELDMVSPALVAASVRKDYTYAHPAVLREAFNWLPRQGRILKSEDLFRQGSGWEAWVKKRVTRIVVRDQLSSQGESLQDANEVAAKAAQVAVKPRYWEIDEKGISPMFTQDEMGYLTSIYMPDITFSWSDLKPYLNPEFQIPR